MYQSRTRLAYALLVGALALPSMHIDCKENVASEKKEMKSAQQGSVYRVKSQQELDNLIKQSGASHAILDFGTEWCGYCKKASPKFKELAAKHPHVLFVYVAADEEPGQALANKYNISGFPAFVFLQDGVEKDRAIGFNNDLLENKACAFAAVAQGNGKKVALAPQVKAEVEQEINQEELDQLVKMVEQEMKKLEAEEKELNQVKNAAPKGAKAESAKKVPAKKAAAKVRGLKDLKSYQELESIVAQSDKPVVVRFHANWCPHCRTNTPVIQKISSELADDAVFVQMEESVMKKHDKDLDKFNIESYPTFIVIGKNVNDHVKVPHKKESLKEDLKKAIAQKAAAKNSAAMGA